MSKANPFPWHDLKDLLIGIGLLSSFIVGILLTGYLIVGAIVW